MAAKFHPFTSEDIHFVFVPQEADPNLVYELRQQIIVWKALATILFMIIMVLCFLLLDIKLEGALSALFSSSHPQ